MIMFSCALHIMGEHFWMVYGITSDSPRSDPHCSMPACTPFLKQTLFSVYKRCGYSLYICSMHPNPETRTPNRSIICIFHISCNTCPFIMLDFMDEFFFRCNINQEQIKYEKRENQNAVNKACFSSEVFWINIIHK